MYVKVVRKVTIKEGPGCLKCFKTWVAGNFLITHQHIGGFWEFCIWVATEMKAKESFMQATEIREGRATATFFSGDVLQQSIVGYRAYKKYVGLTKQQFMDKFHVTPESLGIKLRLLVNEQRRQYSGVLLQDPTDPYVHYEVGSTRGALRNQWRMQADQKLQEDQDAKVFEQVAKEQHGHGMHLHLRNNAF